jgi:hypothetical protein
VRIVLLDPRHRQIVGADSADLKEIVARTPSI